MACKGKSMKNPEDNECNPNGHKPHQINIISLIFLDYFVTFILAL